MNEIIIDCPTCRKIYTNKEYRSLKSIGNFKNLFDAKICLSCGTIFSTMKITGNKDGRLQIAMDLDLFQK